MCAALGAYLVTKLRDEPEQGPLDDAAPRVKLLRRKAASALQHLETAMLRTGTLQQLTAKEGGDIAPFQVRQTWFVCKWIGC